MILDQVLSNSEVLSTSKNASRKVSIGEDASEIIFRIYIKNMYSNPIGSIVREITSNCFDSHIEAGIKKPILIRKGADQHTAMPYISFIDFGVGISPERMDNIYCSLFSSTKRETNEMIGCFGMGSKSVLAYHRTLKYGSNDSDNSFYVITTYEGKKYTYIVYEGKKSPLIDLLNEEDSTDHNGTEIRVPVLESDMYKFNKEILRQLYYFEDIVFEGFDDNSEVTNKYTIIRGKNFLYRGNDYSTYIHACLGKVAYPLDYEVLELNRYDYSFPVAINFNIGEINVVASREAIDYSEDTIKLIKSKLNLAKAELHELLEKQNNKVVTLDEYFKIKNSGDYAVLNLVADKRIKFDNIDFSECKFNNFKYNHIDHIPSFDSLFHLNYKFFTYYSSDKMARRNKKVELVVKYDYFGDNKNCIALFSTDTPDAKRRILIKYLKEHYNKFHIVTENHIYTDTLAKLFAVKDSDLENIQKDVNYQVTSREFTPMYEDIMEFLNEFKDIVSPNIPDLDSVVIPESYTERIKIKRNFIKGNIVINIVTNTGSIDRETIELKKLSDYKGNIVYSDPDGLYRLIEAAQAYDHLFSPSSTINGSYTLSVNINKKKFNDVLFIQVAKGNVKKLLNLGIKLTHIDDVYYKFFHRKAEKIALANDIAKLSERYSALPSFYKTESLKTVYPNLSKIIDELRKFFNDNVNITNLRKSYNVGAHTINRVCRVGYDDKPNKKLDKYYKMIEGVEYISELNNETLSYFNLPYGYENNKTVINLLKSILVSETF